jgi:hypothetical protein
MRRSLHRLQLIPTTILNHSAVPLPPSFDAWTRLTDAYTKQFLLLQSGDRTARLEVMKLAGEVQRMNQEMRSTR